MAEDDNKNVLFWVNMTVWREKGGGGSWSCTAGELWEMTMILCGEVLGRNFEVWCKRIVGDEIPGGCLLSLVFHLPTNDDRG